jgi:hypothetical protein
MHQHWGIFAQDPSGNSRLLPSPRLTCVRTWPQSPNALCLSFTAFAVDPDAISDEYNVSNIDCQNCQWRPKICPRQPPRTSSSRLFVCRINRTSLNSGRVDISNRNASQGQKPCDQWIHFGAYDKLVESMFSIGLVGSAGGTVPPLKLQRKKEFHGLCCSRTCLVVGNRITTLSEVFVGESEIRPGRAVCFLRPSLRF